MVGFQILVGGKWQGKAKFTFIKIKVESDMNRITAKIEKEVRKIYSICIQALYCAHRMMTRSHNLVHGSLLSRLLASKTRGR